jgi:tRNA(Ile)-lysidine synthase
MASKKQSTDVGRADQLRPDPTLVTRLKAALDALSGPEAKLGLAVSGGPDSLTLLLLAAAARPGLVEAATVDHGLRPESRTEAEMVAGVCERLGIPHAILTVEWENKPESAFQERARAERYRLLGQWLKDRELAALVTAHHLDDQAETLLMRLARGSGVRGLAGMRPVSPVPGDGGRLIRPVLSWPRTELEQVCAAAGLTPAADPTNADENFERVRVRKALAEADWLDPKALARSAANLGAADRAIEWAAVQEWGRSVSEGDGAIVYRPGSAPREIRRRIAARAILQLASEGTSQELRGRELDRLLPLLGAGKRATLRGVLCSGGNEWRFSRAPKRKAATG